MLGSWAAWPYICQGSHAGLLYGARVGRCIALTRHYGCLSFFMAEGFGSSSGLCWHQLCSLCQQPRSDGEGSPLSAMTNTRIRVNARSYFPKEQEQFNTQKSVRRGCVLLWMRPNEVLLSPTYASLLPWSCPVTKAVWDIFFWVPLPSEIRWVTHKKDFSVVAPATGSLPSTRGTALFLRQESCILLLCTPCMACVSWFQVTLKQRWENSPLWKPGVL